MSSSERVRAPPMFASLILSAIASLVLRIAGFAAWCCVSNWVSLSAWVVFVLKRILFCNFSVAFIIFSLSRSSNNFELSLVSYIFIFLNRFLREVISFFYCTSSFSLRSFTSLSCFISLIEFWYSFVLSFTDYSNFNRH